MDTSVMHTLGRILLSVLRRLGCLSCDFKIVLIKVFQFRKIKTLKSCEIFKVYLELVSFIHLLLFRLKRNSKAMFVLELILLYLLFNAL